MKKIYTLILAWLCAMSASAITVTYNGKAIENGGTVVAGANVFELIEQIPNVRYSMKAESKIEVSGASNLSLTATSETQKINICQLPSNGGQCYQLNGTAAPYSLSIPSFSDGVNVDLQYDQVKQVPAERHAIDIVIKSNEGDFKFTFVYDTTAGINDLINDANGEYIVYSLLGNCVMRTNDKSDLKSLPAGIYIINGKKFILR